MKWKVVVDTACDFREIPNKAENITYERVPFSLQIEDKVFVDNLDLDIDKMMEEMYASSEPARSACPSPEAYLSAYKGAENVIVFSVNFSGLVKWNTFSWLSPPRSVLSAAVPSTVKVSTVPTRGPIFKSLNVR